MRGTLGEGLGVPETKSIPPSSTHLPSIWQYLLLACTLHPRYYTPKRTDCQTAHHTHTTSWTKFFFLLVLARTCSLLPRSHAHKTSSVQPFSLSLFLLIYFLSPGAVVDTNLLSSSFDWPSLSLKHHTSPGFVLSVLGTNRTPTTPCFFLSFLLLEFFPPPRHQRSHTGLGCQHIYPRTPSNSARNIPASVQFWVFILGPATSGQQQ